jgi:hypothetical protein
MLVLTPAHPAVTMLAAIALALMLLFVAGCTNMAPQYAAQNYAPSYYESSYSSLTPQQKFQLEDHLSNQSNEAWRTSAKVMSGTGKLLGGTGSLLGAIRSIEKPSSGSLARSRNLRMRPRLAIR